MMTIQIDARQLSELGDAVGRARKDFAKELAAAINAVSKKTRLEMGRDIREVVAIPKEESERAIRISATATPNSLQAVVTLKKTKRLGLRHFNAKQDKKGVSYKISKKGGRQRIDGAFQGPKPGVMRMKWRGNVFKRVGKARLPIVQLKGVSTYGAYVKNNLDEPQAKEIAQELMKQMQRRINLNVLRANGLVPK